MTQFQSPSTATEVPFHFDTFQDREKYPKILDFLDENSYVPRERVTTGVLSINRASHNGGENATRTNGFHKNTGADIPLKSTVENKPEKEPQQTREIESENSDGEGITRNNGFQDTHTRLTKPYKGELSVKLGTQGHSGKLHTPRENIASAKFHEDVSNYAGILGKRTGLTPPSVSSPSPSSVASGSHGRKCPICHKTPLNKEPPLVVCNHCKRGFHKACHTPEITQETLSELGDRWQCMQCRKKLQVKSRTSKSLKRSIGSHEDTSELHTFAPHKKPRLQLSSNGGLDIRIATSKFEGLRKNESSVNPCREDAVERNLQLKNSSSHGTPTNVLSHDAFVKTGLAKSPRTLPWNQKGAVSSSRSVVKGEVKRITTFEPESSKKQSYRKSIPLGIFSPSVSVTHHHRVPQNLEKKSIEGPKPVVSEGILVKLDSGPQNNQCNKYGFKNDEHGDTQKRKPSSNINIFAPVGTYADPTATHAVDKVQLEQPALIGDKTALGFSTGKKSKWSPESRQPITDTGAQALKKTQNVPARHPNPSSTREAEIESASYPNNLLSESLPRSSTLDQDPISTTISNEKGKTSSLRDESTAPSPRGITALEKPLDSTARIPEWLEAVSRDGHDASQALPTSMTVLTQQAPPDSSRKENESYQELSDASMSMDTSSSRRGEFDGAGKCDHDQDDNLMIVASRHILGSYKLVDRSPEPGEQVERSETLNQDEIVATQTGAKHAGADKGSLEEETSTNKESSPPYSPPPAKVAEEPPQKDLPSKKPWLCNHQGCTNALAKFGRHGWCKLHAQENEQPQSTTPLLDNKRASPDPLSTLFEFTGPSEGSRKSVADVHSFSNSSAQRSPSFTKSIRLRSEKGRRALSEKNPKRAQEDLEAKVATQTNALSHYAKKVNELNKAVSDSNARIEYYKKEVKDLKSKIGSRIRTVDELNSDLLTKDRENAELAKENELVKENSDRLLQELEDCKSKFQELQANERNLQRAKEAQEEENRGLVIQLQQLRVELSAQQSGGPSHSAENEQGNIRVPAELHALPISLPAVDSCNGQQESEKYGILDPTLDIADPVMENIFRERVSRKANFPCFDTTNLRAIHLHREIIPEHIQGLIGEFTLRKDRVQASSEEQSSSEGIDTVNQLSGLRSNATGTKRNVKIRDTFEQFIGLSQDMVPTVVDHKFLFKKASLKQDGRGTRMERGTQSYRVGRNFPGELR